MNDTILLSDLRAAAIAHTDAGDFVFLGGQPVREVYVKGTITKKRAGLFFLDIEGEQFSTHTKEGFSVGDEVVCYCIPQIVEGVVKSVTVRGLEKN